MTATRHSGPLHITLVDACDLASAGLQALLAPYADRVIVVNNRQAIARPAEVDVVLYEPIGQTSMAQSLLRDLQKASDATPAVFSWAGPDQLPTTTTNAHVPKSLTATQLVVAIEELTQGRYAEAPISVRPLVSSDVHTDVERSPDAAALTPREHEIVGLIVAGMSNREIGTELKLSINSVKTYIRSAYRKMGVERRTQAVLWGLSRGFGATPALVS